MDEDIDVPVNNPCTLLFAIRLRRLICEHKDIDVQTKELIKFYCDALNVLGGDMCDGCSDLMGFVCRTIGWRSFIKVARIHGRRTLKTTFPTINIKDE